MYPNVSNARESSQLLPSLRHSAMHSFSNEAAAVNANPDLTHFAARRTIAATSLPNRRGFLAGWVVDPPGLKPGTEMPRNRLDPLVLQKMLNYLESLR